MDKPIKIYSSETIGRCNAKTTTRGSLRTDQLHRTYARVTSIHGIHIHMRGSLQRSVDESNRQP